VQANQWLSHSTDRHSRVSQTMHTRMEQQHGADADCSQTSPVHLQALLQAAANRLSALAPPHLTDCFLQEILFVQETSSISHPSMWFADEDTLASCS